MKKQLYEQNPQGAQGVYQITEAFEQALCDYTGAPYAIAVDCCSHAIFLSLKYLSKGRPVENLPIIFIPNHTFPSVPCEILHAGYELSFNHIPFPALKGYYQLWPTNVYDSALTFTCGMYIPNSFMCLSFTGPRKHLKLIKGGAILTDNKDAYEWFKCARMSGRHEMPFMEDRIEFPGWDFYMNPEIATRGLMLMREFYDDNRNPIPNEDKELEYPDLSLHPAFQRK